MREAEARRLLAQARDEARAAKEMLVQGGLGMSFKESVQELSSYDNEPADVGTETFEREKDERLLAAREARLRDIEAAEGRIAAGSFGRCVTCGRRLGDDRLRAVPWAERCVTCQEEAEASAGNVRGEADAETVPMPYGVRARPGSDDVGFDGEDAWQAVARYGTANSPQDVPPAVVPTRAYVNASEDRDTVDAADDIVDPEADTPGQAFPSLRRRGPRRPAYDPEDASPSRPDRG